MIILRFYLTIISISLFLILISHKTLKAQENNLSRCHQLMEFIEAEGFDRVTPVSEPLLAEAFIQCIFDANLTAIRKLLDMGIDPDDFRNNEDGSSLLMRATFHNDIDFVNVLLAGGADPDIQNGDKFTALMIASDKGYLDIVIALLDAGANPLITDNNEGIARFFAMRRIMFGQYDNQEHLDNLMRIQSLLREAEENYQNR